MNQQNNFYDKSLFNKDDTQVKSTCYIGLNVRMLVVMTDVTSGLFFKTLKNVMDISKPKYCLYCNCSKLEKQIAII